MHINVNDKESTALKKEKKKMVSSHSENKPFIPLPFNVSSNSSAFALIMPHWTKNI